MAAFCDENVGWLDIAVDDAFAVGGVERVGNFDGEVEQNFCFQRGGQRSGASASAVQKFHHDIRATVFLADIVNGANVGVIECGSGLRFTAKAFQRLRVARQFFGQEFQTDRAMQPRVLGLINHTHPAAAQLLDDSVMGNCSPNERRRIRHGANTSARQASQRRSEEEDARKKAARHIEVI